MSDRGGSSPLSQADHDDTTGKAPPSKFSIDNLISSENAATISSPVPTTAATSPISSPQKTANGTRKRRRTSSSEAATVNGSATLEEDAAEADATAAAVAADDTVMSGDEDDNGNEGAADNDDNDEGDEEGGDEEAEDDDDEDEEDDEEDDDDDDEDDDASTGSRDLEDGPQTPDLEGRAGEVVEISGSDAAPSNDPADGKASNAAGSIAAASGDASTAAKVTKVVKKRKQREPSMDVSLPKGPPSLPTVRVSLKCRPRDHGDYLNNVPEEIYKELKAQSHPWATWYEERRDAPSAKGVNGADARASSSAPPPMMEGLGDMGPFAHLLAKYPVDGPGANGKTRKKRKKRHENEEYDVTDPFVDDSELQIDEPTHSARPASKGFYVVLGDVELEKVGKQKRGGRGAAGGASTPTGNTAGGSRGGIGGAAPPSYLISGTQLEVSNRLIHLRAMERGLSVEPSINPDDIPDDAIGLVGSGQTVAGTADSPIEIKDESTAAASNAKKKSYPTRPVDRRLAAEFEHLKKLVATENFQVKSRFPPSLRPPLRKAARLAVELGEYTDNFFNFMPQIFPYNRFTMSKLIKREFFEDHVAMIKEKQDELVEDLRKAVEAALPQHQKDYEEALQQWKSGGGADKGTTATATAAATRENSAEEAGEAASGEAAADKPANGTAAAAGAEPMRKWKWTERMRECVFQIILIENGISELRIEKSKLENSLEQISELNQRKGAYKRIHDLWPENEGWTTTTGISKEHAIQKKKHDRHNNALAEQQAAAAAAI